MKELEVSFVVNIENGCALIDSLWDDKQPERAHGMGKKYFCQFQINVEKNICIFPFPNPGTTNLLKCGKMLVLN